MLFRKKQKKNKSTKLNSFEYLDFGFISVLVSIENLALTFEYFLAISWRVNGL